MIRASALALLRPLKIRHDDPLTAKANILALSIASNQPLYPLTLHLVLGRPFPAAWWSLLSTPFFLAVPFVARRRPVWGRSLLVAAGIGNTLLCGLLFGSASGVGLFFLPCILLAASLFRREERRLQWPLLALAVLAYLLLPAGEGGAVQALDPAQQDKLRGLHQYSVALLTALIGLLLRNDDKGPRL